MQRNRQYGGWGQCQGEERKGDFFYGKGVSKYQQVWGEDLSLDLCDKVVVIFGNEF